MMGVGRQQRSSAVGENRARRCAVGADRVVAELMANVSSRMRMFVAENVVFGREIVTLAAGLIQQRSAERVR